MRLLESRPNLVPYSCLAPLPILRVDRLPRRKIGWKVPPSTIGLQCIHDRFQHQPPCVFIGTTNPLGRRQQLLESLPNDRSFIVVLCHAWRYRFLLGCCWCSALYFHMLLPSIVVIASPRLMPAPPVRPRQHHRCALLDTYYHLPEQLPYFRAA
jgi:hypothetical protein